MITVFYTIFVYALCLKRMQYQNALQQAKKKSEKHYRCNSFNIKQFWKISKKHSIWH